MTPRLRRQLRAGFIYTHDAAMAALSFLLSLALRLGQNPWDYSPDLAITGTVAFTGVAVAVFVGMQAHREVWQYTSTPELLRILRAATYVILLFVVLLFWVTRLEDLPRSALVINWFVLVMLLTGPRILYRLLRQGSGDLIGDRATDRIPVLLVGAGDGTERFLRMLATDSDPHYRVVAIADAKGTRVGRRIRGCLVGGSIEDIDSVMESFGDTSLKPRRFIITEDSVDGETTARLLEIAAAHGVTLARLPRMTDFRSADAAGIEPRPVAIEDILGRPQQVLDRAAMDTLIRGHRVLVTGAGGTIGGELTRQVAALGPSQLTLVDSSEYALYAIDLEIREAAPELARDTVLADVRDRVRTAEIIAAARPDIVFHAAALKHVPIVEAHPEEGVLTNAIGTRNVADACRGSGVGAMVLISTDKAVNPAAVMGATKRIAESYCQALNLAREAGGETGRGVGDTRFITVRFGNVLGSTGSVVPLFQRQLDRGGPLTVTHPDMTRYFMTVREAVELVLEATVLGTGDGPHKDGGGSAIYVLDMGQPVRIYDLARQMIRLAGLTPGEDVEIRITGLRPGEKLHETLFHDAEVTEPTRYPGVLIARPRPLALEALDAELDRLAEAAEARDRTAVIESLVRLVPDYVPEHAPPKRAREAAG